MHLPPRAQSDHEDVTDSSGWHTTYYTQPAVLARVDPLLAHHSDGGGAVSVRIPQLRVGLIQSHPLACRRRALVYLTQVLDHRPLAYYRWYRKVNSAHSLVVYPFSPPLASDTLPVHRALPLPPPHKAWPFIPGSTTGAFTLSLP